MTGAHHLESPVSNTDIGKSVTNRLLFGSDHLGSPLKDPFNVYRSTALSVRDQLIDNLNSTTEFFQSKKVRHLNYLSIEFLQGRAMRNQLLNLGLEDQVRRSLQAFGKPDNNYRLRS